MTYFNSNAPYAPSILAERDSTLSFIIKANVLNNLSLAVGALAYASVNISYYDTSHVMSLSILTISGIALSTLACTLVITSSYLNRKQLFLADENTSTERRAIFHALKTIARSTIINNLAFLAGVTAGSLAVRAIATPPSTAWSIGEVSLYSISSTALRYCVNAHGKDHSAFLITGFMAGVSYNKIFYHTLSMITLSTVAMFSLFKTALFSSKIYQDLPYLTEIECPICLEDPFIEDRMPSHTWSGHAVNAPSGQHQIIHGICAKCLPRLPVTRDIQNCYTCREPLIEGRQSITLYRDGRGFYNVDD